MLSDTDIDRYSRQILLSEIGGRGQERLLKSRVLVDGANPAAEHARLLLARAGVAVADGGAVDCVVTVRADLETITARVPLVVASASDTELAVATLLGRPCVRCVAPEILHTSDDRDATLSPIVQQALGALAAGEVLLVLLGQVQQGRAQRVALASGACEGRLLPTRDGCPVCEDSA